MVINFFSKWKGETDDISKYNYKVNSAKEWLHFRSVQTSEKIYFIVRSHPKSFPKWHNIRKRKGIIYLSSPVPYSTHYCWWYWDLDKCSEFDGCKYNNRLILFYFHLLIDTMDTCFLLFWFTSVDDNRKRNR